MTTCLTYDTKVSNHIDQFIPKTDGFLTHWFWGNEVFA